MPVRDDRIAAVKKGSKVALSELSELTGLLSTLKGVINAMDQLLSEVQDKAKVEVLTLSELKSIDTGRGKLRHNINVQSDSVWDTVDKATTADDTKAFADIFVAALAKVETARRLCKYEDDRLFAALSIKEIIASLQGQPVDHFACDTRPGHEEVPTAISLLKMLREAVMQVQLRKAQLELEVEQMAQVQLHTSAELQAAQTVADNLRSRSVRDKEQIVAATAELSEAREHMELRVEMLSDSQVKAQARVNELTAELQRAKAASADAEQKQHALEAGFAAQKRVHDQLLRRAQDNGKAAVAQVEAQLQEARDKLEAAEQRSHNLDRLMAAEEKTNQQTLRDLKAKDKTMDHLRNKVEHWKAEAGVAQDQQQHMARQLNVRQRAYDDLVPQLAAKQRFLDAAEEQLVDRDMTIAKLRRQVKRLNFEAKQAEQHAEEGAVWPAAQQQRPMVLQPSQVLSLAESRSCTDLQELSPEDLKALPQAGRAVFNAMDSSCQAGSSIDGMNSESEVPPGFAPAQPQELPGFSQAADRSGHWSGAPPPGLRTLKSSTLQHGASQDMAAASTHQTGIDRSVAPGLERVHRSSISRDPSPHHGTVPSPSDSSESNETAMLGAGSSFRLPGVDQESWKGALQASDEMPSTSTWSDDDSQPINVERWTGRRQAPAEDVPAEGAQSDEWAFVGNDGCSYGVVTKAMMVSFWKKKKLLSQVFVHHASEGRRGGQQLHRFQKQWKESGQLPTGLEIQALDADTAFSQLRVVGGANT